ncbi:MAG: Asp-tRNA(Asn)/Glu-tRNA(Gln) amidotransferase GatCAB subunit A, partial [Coriobacteriales bacterium]|nr:Asp-tRNA(Asn)/Glu-tRNA(Gln) amidotransferase GatCAB subunit A [Coriobacteriales bacterium]
MRFDEYKELSLCQMAAAVRARELDPAELRLAALAAIEEFDPKVGALLSLCELDSEQAQTLDAQGAKSLAGVPMAFKDNMNLIGSHTTCASRMLADYLSPYTATCVQRCLDAGATAIGKLNMDEFAFGSSTETSAFHPTHNPWDLARVPGGSSGGSAAAVAAGMLPATLGSDTGGSIRQPAAFCGVVGMKPTYGVVSRYGVVAFGSSLDQVGPFARSVADVATVLDAISGRDPLDCTSQPVAQHFADYVQRGVEGMRIGVV